MSNASNIVRRAALLIGLLALISACDSGSSGNTVDSATAGTSTSGTNTSGTSTSGASGTALCEVIQCAGKTTECGDCLDNDNDGRTDWRDPECLGPCDNTEGPVLSAGVGGETGNQCGADCYFDFGNGPGNDNCSWDRKCDPNSPKDDSFTTTTVECKYDRAVVGTSSCPASQSSACASACPPLTPNGCDCFGCCTMPNLRLAQGDYGYDAMSPNKPRYVFIGSEYNGAGSCTYDQVEDRTKCHTCQPVTDAKCNNTCGTCELCVNKTSLPPECTGGTSGTSGSGEPRCPPNYQVCGLAGDAPCATGFFCLTGCCVPAPH